MSLEGQGQESEGLESTWNEEQFILSFANKHYLHVTSMWGVGFKQKLAILAKTKQGLISLEKKGLKVKF